LETDPVGAVISYEEYYPYGGSSFRAGDEDKRYRFASKERDEETGLYYFGARYYAPWIARWLSLDPGGTRDGTNRYWYARDNPVTLVDQGGMDASTPEASTPEVTPEEQARREQWRAEYTQKALAAAGEAIEARNQITNLKHLSASDMLQFMKEPNLEKAEELRLSLISTFENIEHQAKVATFAYALAAENPPPPPPPPDRLVEFDVQPADSKGFHPEVQALYTYNQSPSNLRGFSSIDAQVILPLKDYSGIKINLIKDKLTLSLLHEFAIGGVVSTHIKDPSDASTPSVHIEPLVQVDLFDLDSKLIGPEIELKATLVGQYDFYSGGGQGQVQGSVQLHLGGGPASLVIQGTDPFNAPKSVSGGVEVDF
jgi:RHS repeat-associated protein